SRARRLEAVVHAPKGPDHDLETPHPDASRDASVTHGAHLGSPVPLRRSTSRDRLPDDRLSCGNVRITIPRTWSGPVDDLGRIVREDRSGRGDVARKAERQRQGEGPPAILSESNHDFPSQSLNTRGRLPVAPSMATSRGWGSGGVGAGYGVTHIGLGTASFGPEQRLDPPLP